jgi:hypothetical protein
MVRGRPSVMGHQLENNVSVSVFRVRNPLYVHGSRLRAELVFRLPARSRFGEGRTRRRGRSSGIGHIYDEN